MLELIRNDMVCNTPHLTEKAAFSWLECNTDEELFASENSAQWKM